MQILVSFSAPVRASAAVQYAAYDALELLRIADAQLGEVDARNVLGIQSAVRVQVAILEQIVTGAPTLPDRVFRTIADHPDHYEGGLLALMLAGQRFEEACALSAQLDGPDVDDFYSVLESARQTIECCSSFLAGDHPGEAYVERILADILAGKPAQTSTEMMVASARRHYPHGIPADVLAKHEAAWGPASPLLRSMVVG